MDFISIMDLSSFTFYYSVTIFTIVYNLFIKFNLKLYGNCFIKEDFFRIITIENNIVRVAQ